jgi:hypothetical protein
MVPGNWPAGCTLVLLFCAGEFVVVAFWAKAAIEGADIAATVIITANATGADPTIRNCREDSIFLLSVGLDIEKKKAKECS